MLKLIASTAALCAALFAAPPARAATTERTEQVEVTLLAADAVVRPGQTLDVALRQRIAPHWHTYWVNPGDSGQATSIAWTLPAGASAGDIEWPAPTRQALGPVTNYGYEGEVLLLTKLTVPADASGRFVAKAAVDWLVCKDICIPQQAELALELPVAAATVSGPDAAALAAVRAALPKAAPWPVRATAAGQGLTLAWPAATGDAAPKAWFFPAQWGVVNHSAPQPLERAGELWQLRLPAGEAPLAPGKALSGVLAIGEGPTRAAYAIDAPLAVGAAPARAAAVMGTTNDALGLAAALGLALAGGLVLNLMPCVFPVLSIKALSLLAAARDGAATTRRHGLAYTAGVLASFAALALLLVALRAAGAEIGWGFQFQSSLFVLLVAYLLFAVGLSLSGLLEIGASLTGLGSGLASRSGYAGSFFTGVLATVVATPCTAPFMGAALAFALSEPAPQLVAVFLALGLGLALPYLLLAWWPALQRWLPRPGAWMETFKQALAFPMYAAAVWLVWVLAQQSGPSGVLIALAGLVLIAFAAWLRRIGGSRLPARAGALASAALALAGGLWLPPPEAAVAASTAASTGGGAPSEPYTPERLQALRAAGQPVFVNLTAAWCISCIVNEKVALSRPDVADAFARAGVTYLKGDWTRKDARVSALLAEYGRTGVPLYLYFPAGAGKPAAILPQLLTPAIVIDALAASSSTVE